MIEWYYFSSFSLFQIQVVSKVNMSSISQSFSQHTFWHNVIRQIYRCILIIISMNSILSTENWYSKKPNSSAFILILDNFCCLYKFIISVKWNKYFGSIILKKKKIEIVTLSLKQDRFELTAMYAFVQNNIKIVSW